jgi:lysophospholipase L1-like esterase
LVNQYYRGDSTTIVGPLSLNGCYCILIPVKSGDKFIINGNGPTTTIALVSIADESKTIIRQIYGSYRNNPQTIIIGDNESYMAVNFYNYDSSVDNLIQVEPYTTNQLYESIKELEQGEPGGTRNWFWKGKNVVVFGDSISEFKSSLSGDKGWTDRFAELSESNVFNGAIGGSRISARRATILPVSESETNTENSYRAYNSLDVVNLVKAWVSNNWSVVDTNVAWLANNVSDNNTGQINHLKSIPVADADVVIISAGTNDWHNGSTDGADTLDNFNVQQIYGALNNIVKDILSVNTKIRLYFLTPIPRYVSRGVPTFSTSEDYAVGDLVMYNNAGYVFTSAHTAGAWDSSQVRTATDLDYRRDECSSDVVQVDGRTLLTFAENEISFIHRYHLPIADMYKNCGFNKYNWSNYFPDNDNTHPHKGYVYLGERIYTIISAL